MRTRIGLGAVGVVLGAYGVWLLLSRQSLDQLFSAAVWLAGGVIAHDLVLAPLVIGAAWLGARTLPVSARGPVAIGALVLGSLTVLAIPVLGGGGRLPDNPTLLDRDYGTGWWVVAGCVAAAVAVAVAVRSFRASRMRGQGDGPDSRHR